jgi:hypothetical protein
VARMRIYVRQSLRATAETISVGSEPPLTIPFLRLFAMMRIGHEARVVAESILDTGAPLTVFPRKMWRQFESEIEWLPLSKAQTTNSWLTNLRGRTGGRSDCRIGRVFVELFDLERPQHFLRFVRIVAQFELTDFPDERVITGLHGGILEGRRLILETDRRQAWIEEER